MSEKAARIAEIERRITIIRDNIRELTEQAAAVTGIAAEDATADRIAAQEQELAELTRTRETLAAQS